MRPYLYLRRWWRRTTPGNRAVTTVAGLVVIALLAWAFAPTGDDGESTAANAASNQEASDARQSGDGTANGGPASASAQPAPGATAAGDVAGAPGGATGAARAAGASGAAGRGTTGPSRPSVAVPAGRGCLSAPRGTPGVSDKTLTVAAAIVDLAGPIGNSAAGLAGADELVRMAEAVAADVNARGGMQCRTVTLKTYRVNPISQDQAQASCLALGEGRPFIALDFGAFAFPQGMYQCVPRQKIPLVEALSVTPSEVKKFQPYLSSVNSDLGSGMRTLANGLKSRGWFDSAKGFKKLGLLYDDCSPEVNGLLDAALAKILKPAQIDKFVFACPSGGFAPPNQVGQAATQHRLAGVTHVIPLTGSGSFPSYTHAAESQGFRPKYAISDYQGLILTQSGPLGASANRDNFDRGMSITQTRYGQEATPSVPPDPGTARCRQILIKAGFTANDVYRGGGIICSTMWTVEAAVKHTTVLTREGVLPGLFRAGPVQMAFPYPDAVFRSPLKLTGGDTWWPVEWHKEDGKFHVLDPNRKPSWP